MAGWIDYSRNRRIRGPRQTWTRRSTGWPLCLASVAGAGAAWAFDRRDRADAAALAEQRFPGPRHGAAEAAERWRGKLLASQEHAVTAGREAEGIRRPLA
ncbi:MULTISPECIES: hypothetical protein [unclassified Nocardiopsis]|uniref:hypothetical protein n=1 Tax=unclassified Nocardiopsis TaxID=2649073 RepID=UPI0013599208|nr:MULTISPECIES: hypothetical protein [unclassified Nocardiopsis]